MIALFYVSMVILCIFAFTTWAKYQNKWDRWDTDDKIMCIYLPAVFWPASLIGVTLYFIGVTINYIFDSWTTNLANFFKKDK